MNKNGLYIHLLFVVIRRPSTKTSGASTSVEHFPLDPALVSRRDVKQSRAVDRARWFDRPVLVCRIHADPDALVWPRLQGGLFPNLRVPRPARQRYAVAADKGSSPRHTSPVSDDPSLLAAVVHSIYRNDRRWSVDSKDSIDRPVPV